MAIQKDYLERVYAGWLGKIIGVRYGAPIEGFSYDRIRKTLGTLDGYVADYLNFAADDDTNGPLFFLRAIDDYGLDAGALQMGLTLLNYAPYEHGFFWWGGYGRSTEHTAYLNLRAGINAPRSGSAEQNGEAIAEQIGGQIFCDIWGLIAPENPQLAADYAERMASVTHGGNGVYGARFIAACIAKAFGAGSVNDILEAGLSVIPETCEYALMTRAVMAFCAEHTENWEDCFRFVRENYGYDRYPGNCHIIPNSAVIVLSLICGGGDFDRALSICNMCGWDTDCNVANVGTIMGVKNGLCGISYAKWRAPINDFLAASGVMGSLNITNIPQTAAYIAGFGYRLAGVEPPEEWRDIIMGKSARFHFELDGSTHAFRCSGEYSGSVPHVITNSVERAASGNRSLKLVVNNFPLENGEGVRLFHKTYYESKDFSDSRYDPAFSPILYPGMALRCMVSADEEFSGTCYASLYVYDRNSERLIEGNAVKLGEAFTALDWQIPPGDGVCISEAGVIFRTGDCGKGALVAWLDDFDIQGSPDYSIDFAKERIDTWNGGHSEISQFTRLKGVWELGNGALDGHVADFGEAYTGAVFFDNYELTATLTPKLGGWHGINVRVQGAVRSYAVVLRDNGTLCLMKNENGYHALAEVSYTWEHGRSYTLTVRAKGSRLTVTDNGKVLIEYTDTDKPYLNGAVGASLRDGSRCEYRDFRIRGV